MDKRQGPKVTIEKRCFGCAFETSESYQIQGDSGNSVYCIHPAVGKKHIGDTTWNTPAWCPIDVDPVAEAAREEREAIMGIVADLFTGATAEVLDARHRLLDAILAREKEPTS